MPWFPALWLWYIRRWVRRNRPELVEKWAVAEKLIKGGAPK